MDASASPLPVPFVPSNPPGGQARLCPCCAVPMALFAATRNSGQSVELDYCAGCQAVWFDAKESLQLSGLGWVALLRLLASAGETATDFGQKSLSCSRCRASLNAIHNQTRTGRFVVYRCMGCGGHFQTQVGVLAQWGHYRQALAADWAVLAKEGQGLACQSCGAGIAVGASACEYCKTPAFVLDLARLSQSLQLPDVQASLDDIAGPSRSARAATWPCHACGNPLDPLVEAVCGVCQHPVVVTRLHDVMPALDAAEAQLKNPPPKRADRPLPKDHAKATQAQQHIDRMTSGFSASGDRKALWVGGAFALFVFVLLGLVRCMKM